MPCQFFLASFLCLLTAAEQAAACDVCAIYIAAGARGEFQPGFVAGAAVQYTRFDTLQEDGREVANPCGQYLDSTLTQLFLGYGVNERLGVQLNVPFIFRSFERPEGFATDKGTEVGVGDVSLLGKFQVWRKETQDFTFDWNVLGGLELPTGNTDRLKEELHEVEVPGAPESGIHGHDLTLGSGSIDGIVTWRF